MTDIDREMLVEVRDNVRELSKTVNGRRGRGGLVRKVEKLEYKIWLIGIFVGSCMFLHGGNAGGGTGGAHPDPKSLPFPLRIDAAAASTPPAGSMVQAQ